MKLPNISKLFKTKTYVRNKFLLEEYEKGRVLQVDNNKDNKEIFKKK